MDVDLLLVGADERSAQRSASKNSRTLARACSTVRSTWSGGVSKSAAEVSEISVSNSSRLSRRSEGWGGRWG